LLPLLRGFETEKKESVMTRNAILIAILALAVSGCARHSGHTASTEAAEPAASVASLEPVAGHWRGELYETGGSLVTGVLPVDITINDDGTWRGTVGKLPASGTARMRKGQLVLEGTAIGPDGRPQAVYYTLKGDDARRWGQTMTTFGGRDARASVSLARQA
jgi:hypothetical protein